MDKDVRYLGIRRRFLLRKLKLGFSEAMGKILRGFPTDDRLSEYKLKKVSELCYFETPICNDKKLFVSLFFEVLSKILCPR